MTRFAPVEAPAAERPRINLLAAARTPSGETFDGVAVRWQEGVEYVTRASGMVALADPCNPEVTEIRAGCATGEVDGTPTAAELGRTVQTAAAYAVAEYECSIVGADLDDYVARAMETLNAELPRAVEHELWFGTNAIANDHPTNRYLAATGSFATALSASATSPVVALGMLEQALAAVYSGTGIIHTDRLAFTALHEVGMFQRTGNIVETLAGNRVVPGVGYGTASPAGVAAAAGSAWVYITPMVTVRLGEPELPTVDQVRTAMIDRGVNKMSVRARAPFTVDWDSCSPAYGIRVTLDA